MSRHLYENNDRSPKGQRNLVLSNGSSDTDIGNAPTGSKMKRGPYDRITPQRRKQLCNRVAHQEEDLKKVAQELGINPATAKSILEVYRKTGRTNKKETRDRVKKKVVPATIKTVPIIPTRTPPRGIPEPQPLPCLPVQLLNQPVFLPTSQQLFGNTFSVQPFPFVSSFAQNFQEPRTHLLAGLKLLQTQSLISPLSLPQPLAAWPYPGGNLLGQLPVFPQNLLNKS